MPLPEMCETCRRYIYNGQKAMRLLTKYHCKKCAPARLFPRIGEKVCAEVRFRQPRLYQGERTIGFEIEGNWTPEAAYRIIAEKLGGFKNDGSLRGADAGELISKVMKSTNYTEWLREIPLGDMEANDRCGLHLWLGAEDLSWSDINRILYYAKIHRKEIFSLVANTRQPAEEKDGSGRPLQIGWTARLYKNKEDFLRSLYGIAGMNSLRDRDNDKSRMQASKRANDRNKDGHYDGPINRAWWLNVHGYWHRRALEIRLLHSTSCHEVIYAFTETWLRMIHTIPNMSTRQLYEVPVVAMVPKFAAKIFKGARRTEMDNGGHVFHPNNEDTVRKLVEMSKIMETM